MAVGLSIAGLVLLVALSELVLLGITSRGNARLSLMVIGLTIVSIETSAPELEVDLRNVAASLCF